MRLNEVLFHEDLHVALGVVPRYIHNLVMPGNSKVYQSYKFPKPCYVFPGGTRVWALSDVTEWALDMRRRKHPSFGVSTFIAGWPLLEHRQANLLSELWG